MKLTNLNCEKKSMLLQTDEIRRNLGVFEQFSLTSCEPCRKKTCPQGFQPGKGGNQKGFKKSMDTHQAKLDNRVFDCKS